ncbi:hypothetical protein LQ318_09710 [Aliifodinibius salicampi]|uniref:Cell division protein FtsL n=1 Tax=Fodinibius salicampi TaxID=1920655 RepID=A0ABT3PZC2_9BACT|nr:hypothetical protein [Fodinibius salicampi]MCW9713180.1 hypothetical protein [Fodinibius salicampi]
MKKKKVRPNKRKKSSEGSKQSSKSKKKVYGKRVNNNGKKSRFSLPKVTLKPWKVILGAVVLGILGMLYLNHVFATQELLREVQQLEREYNQAKRLHGSYQLTYDRMIGPAEIYDKAKENGFINGGPAEKVIKVEK